jgi:glucose-1-phosphate adenylyltransferase
VPRVLSVILGGGKGTRLYPLTKLRAKPAVPFGGKYRLVDIPVSNSIHSGYKHIFILTQFNSASLHRHVAHTYQFDSFTRGFVSILAAEQTFEHSGWYEGTADAVRKNMSHFRPYEPSDYVILSGDQLYRMDIQELVAFHHDTGADVTVAATPVARDQTAGFGILQVKKGLEIEEFVEKPASGTDIDVLRIRESYLPEGTTVPQGKEFLASMGIYVFTAEAMERALANELTDFGKEIIPHCIHEMKTYAYVYSGFWEDIGTIRSFYEANLDLAAVTPQFNFYDEDHPIYTHRRDLPASKINSSTISQALTADGCIITDAQVRNSIVGIRTVVEPGSRLDGVVCMGADYYETPKDTAANRRAGVPNVGIGSGTAVANAIIDKNARIGSNCRVGVDEIAREPGDHGMYYVVDGIVVIPKDTVVPDGTVI